MLQNNILKAQLLAFIIFIGGCSNKPEISGSGDPRLHGIEFIECFKCFKTFKAGKDFKSHFNDTHGVKCSKCSRSFTTEQDLERHFNAIHIVEDFEGYKGSTVVSILEELERIKRTRQAEHKFNCTECFKNFKEKKGLKKHFNIKHRVKQIESTKTVKADEDSERDLEVGNSLAGDMTPYQGPNRCYGYYKCRCGKKWESGNSWANTYQTCKRCNKHVYPYYQTALEHSVNNLHTKKEHPQDLCQKCIQLGSYCRNYTSNLR